MEKQISIKEIAKIAGVSAGTVDRVIHNRGKVSRKAKEAVEAVLSEVNYKLNIHASAISLKKGFKLLITIPSSSPGEYWDSMAMGFSNAIKEYSDIRISTDYWYYDQFDEYSCKEAFTRILEQEPDGVIIGPTFKKETKELCDNLDSRSIPYVFVDASIDDTKPVATFTTDQEACGKLIGKILFSIIGEDKKIAVFGIKRKGDSHSENSSRREKGLEDFASEAGKKDSILRISIPISGNTGQNPELKEFFEDNRGIEAVAVMNSRGHIVADILKANGINNIKIISFDLTRSNMVSLDNGEIFALLCQRPQLQGYWAIETLIRYLLYNIPEAEPHNILPIDIVVKENLPFYREIIAK